MMNDEVPNHPTPMRRVFEWSACLLTLCLFGCSERVPSVELISFAVLPADHFVAGPTSGQFIEPANGRTPPFEKREYARRNIGSWATSCPTCRAVVGSRAWR